MTRGQGHEDRDTRTVKRIWSHLVIQVKTHNIFQQVLVSCRFRKDLNLRGRNVIKFKLHVQLNEMMNLMEVSSREKCRFPAPRLHRPRIPAPPPPRSHKPRALNPRFCGLSEPETSGSSSSVSSVPEPPLDLPVGSGRSRMSRTENPVLVIVPKDMARAWREGEARQRKRGVAGSSPRSFTGCSPLKRSRHRRTCVHGGR